MMIKLFFAALPMCLAIGAAIGYRISESEREYLISKFNREGYAIAATMPKPKPVPITRPELEQRLIACIGKPLRLQSFTDKDLNDSLFECEQTAKS
jgi:hypothetical protein